MVTAKLLSLQRMAGDYQADDLTNSDQVISDSLVQYSISGRAETINKSWFGDMRLSTNYSISGLLPCF